MAKSDFTVSYYNQKPIYLGQFDNNISGFEEMINRLKSYTNAPIRSWFICFENTGVYSKALLEWLISQQIACREENALKIAKSRGMQRGKDDRNDSRTICRYAYEKRDSLKPTQLPKPLIVKLKKLLARRDFLVRQKQSLSVSLQDQERIMDPTHFKLFKKQNDQMIQLYKKQIKLIEKEIAKVISDDEMVKKNYDLACSVIGIGPITSAYMIATTNNFADFKTARKYGTYCGIAPFKHHQSGIKKGVSRVNHMANKKMKSLLSNGARAAVLFDPQIKCYSQKKLAQGKEKGVVLNNVKNKLVQRVFAVVKRQQSYVKLNAYG